MTERRKSSFFIKDTSQDKRVFHYLNEIQQQQQQQQQAKGKRNSIVKYPNASIGQDIKKRNSNQLTNQDINLISEKIRKSIFLQTDVDLTQLITSTTGRNTINPAGINNLTTIDRNTNGSKRTTIKQGTQTTSKPPIIPLINKRKTYKNNQDLFSQTLNCKLKHRSDITNQLLLNTQIRILKKKQLKKKNIDHIPIFNNTIQLNKYIIDQYHIGNNKESNAYSRRKQKISDETFSVIRKKKAQEIKKQNKTAMMITLTNSDRNYTIESNDSSMNNGNYNEDEVKLIRQEYYDKRKKERLLMANTFLSKLEDLSTVPYQQMDRNNLINYKNLSRVMQVMKIRDKSQSNSINKQKLKLHEDEAKVLLATSKLGAPLYAKSKLKKETHSKYIGIKGSYFGYPV